jgi:K(+)-stimulated pyrophosphate-energized sodium pump
MQNIIYLVPAVGIVSLLFALWRASWINKQEAGSARMQEIAGYIRQGAMSYLNTQYRVLTIFAVVMCAFLGFISYNDPASSPFIILAFLVGAVFSALAGYSGMSVATKANVRTTNAARNSLSKALDVSFAGGSVMGMSVVGLGLLGLSLLFVLFNTLFNSGGSDMLRVLNVLTGFSLGAESIALFARVGGGIFTKAADVGADLAGKVVAGIPEDDPRNPAVIADNVGDNVGDVAGMGADLFGSYVSTILATMVLGAGIITGDMSMVVLPLLIAAVGTLFSIVATFFVRVSETGNPQTSLNIGNWGSVVLTALVSYFIINATIPANFTEGAASYASINIFYAVLVGLGVGVLVSLITEHYCSLGRGPVTRIINSSTNAGTNVISGLSVGMESTALPMLVLAGGIVWAYSLAGLYGVAMAATGMMATTGMQLAIDAFGPIADNAGGIAEMGIEDKAEGEATRHRTDILDTVGNTTAAIGKGFAIASAALTSLALFAAFMESAKIDSINISDPKVLAGLMIGAMIPYLFSSWAIRAVGSAATDMVKEVARQFKEIPGLLEGKAGVKPDYEKCISISTNAAIRQMIAPGLLAILSPIIVGFAFGPFVLGGMLAGVLVSGLLMAIFQSNAGGAWDNAKKSFEKGVTIDGKNYKKGSDPHKAAVVGDTVGDPLKDTSGPSMNILIKLTSIVALIIATMIAAH